jgi:hypothetical protein
MKFSCKHYVAIIFLIIGTSFLLIEMLSPFYYDSIVKQDGFKLAGKLGANFEDIEGSAYLKPNSSSKMLFEAKVPHMVVKQEKVV